MKVLDFYKGVGLGVTVGGPDVWVAAGSGAWLVQAAKVMNVDTTAPIGSLVVRVLLFSCLSIGAQMQIRNRGE